MADIIPISRELTPELGHEAMLGGETEEYGFFAAPGQNPIGLSLRSVLEYPDGLGTEEVPAKELVQLYERFELWLIPHSVSIVRRGGGYEPAYVGLEVQYKNQGRTCSIRSLIPSPHFVTHGWFRAVLGLSGELSEAGSEPLRSAAADVLGLSIGVQASAELRAVVSATVVTPFIAAVGLESDRCEWRFDRHDTPLFGCDIRTFAVVALPRRQNDLTYGIRYYIGLRKFILTRRIESDWCDVQCKLSRASG